MANGRGAYFGPDLFSSDNQFINVTAQSGLIFNTPARQGGFTTMLPSPERLDDRGGAGGEKTLGAARAARNGRGALVEGFGDAVLFNKIYVEIVDITADPNEHLGQSTDAGFITEELSYIVLIWNSYITASKDFTAVTAFSADGTTLTYPTLPQTITPGGDVQCALTIDIIGPALQDTTYRFTVDGGTDDISITGMRVLAMLPEPDWRNGVNHSYQYQTAMFQTARFSEQRRSLVDAPAHSTKANFVMAGAEAQRFFHNLSYGHDKIFGVPIYNELMIPTSVGLPAGSPTITLDTTKTDPSDMWNLNNTASYVAIIDHENALSEIKEVSSIGASTIVCTQNISTTFDEATARVYPIYFGLIKASTLQQRTDGIDTVKLDFTEFNNGG